MDGSAFDSVAKLFATNRLSRRKALAGAGGALVTCAGITAIPGLQSAVAQESTPEAETSPSPTPPTLIFV